MEVDIAIIGGGIAGCTAAIALAKFYNVVLIDKLAQPPERIGECLAPASRRILGQLDLLDGLEKALLPTGQVQHLKHMGTFSYWGSEKVQIVDHLRNPDGFGWHLNRQAFEIYLRETVQQRGVTCCWPARLNDVRYDASRWQLNVTMPDDITNETSRLSAKFVIDASGRQSYFARTLGIERQHFDKLIACWATMPNREVNQMSTISASEYGWWYSAPLPGNRRVMVLQTDSDLIRHGIIKDAAHFLELAQSNKEMARLVADNAADISFHKMVAANSTRLHQVAGQQWAALGDAAISFDPLSSQGMFNAMASAVQVAELIKELDFINTSDTVKATEFAAIYTEQINQIWKHYEKHKLLFYSAEMRWKDAVFWQRRQGNASL